MLNTVLGFLLTLGILIVVHEYGHYKVARLCGVRVLRFSVGFGRVIWRRQSAPGATEFTLSAIPLGGYVRMLDNREELVPAHLQHETFDRKPLRSRVAIVAAGPVANLMLAVLLYAGSFAAGLQGPVPVLSTPAQGSLAAQADLRAGDVVQAVADEGGRWHDTETLGELRWQITLAILRGNDLQLQISDANGAHVRRPTLALSTLSDQELSASMYARIGIGAAFSEPLIKDTTAGGPAEKAGLRAGDLVLSIDGQAVPDTQALVDRIRARRSTDIEPMRWSVERNGQRIELEVMPRLVTANGETFGRIDAPVGGAPVLAQAQLGWGDSLLRGAERTAEMCEVNLRMLGRILTGQASLRNLSGPLTIADQAGQSIQLGLSYYLGFLAMVSVSLGVLNLLPLPMLDGGHLMYYLFEGVTGRPVSDLWLKWLQRSGAAVLLLMMTIALSNDVARLLGLQ